MLVGGEIGRRESAGNNFGGRGGEMQQQGKRENQGQKDTVLEGSGGSGNSGYDKHKQNQ